MKYDAYTDGGCRGNQNKVNVGAWGFIIYKDNGERLGSRSAGTRNTTNNEMEMKAVHELLLWANKGNFRELRIHLDSDYVKQGCMSWRISWKRKGWKKADGGEVLNLDLWKAIDAELDKYAEVYGKFPEFIKVKGHSGIFGNEEVDNLVNVRMTEVEMEDM